jgi:hypothetical protein
MAMMFTTRRQTALWVLACAAVLGGARPAGAQAQATDRFYVAVGGLADVKRFSTSGGSNTLDGTAAGISVAGGVRFTPRWDLELNVDIPGYTTHSDSRNFGSGRLVFPIELRTKNRPLTTSALVRFRGSPHGRLQLGYLAGVSIVRFDTKVDVVAPPNVLATVILPSMFGRVDYAAAPVIGLDAEITLTEHLAVVPGFHASVFSAQDTTAVLLRPRAGVRWTF